jgi:hypothetical protein
MVTLSFEFNGTLPDKVRRRGLESQTPRSLWWCLNLENASGRQRLNSPKKCGARVCDPQRLRKRKT